MLDLEKYQEVGHEGTLETWEFVDENPDWYAEEFNNVLDAYTELNFDD